MDNRIPLFIFIALISFCSFSQERQVEDNFAKASQLNESAAKGNLGSEIRIKQMADAGDASAMFFYSQMLMNGQNGIAKDIGAGFQMLDGSAAKGCAAAQLLYGSLLAGDLSLQDQEKKKLVSYLQSASRSEPAIAAAILSAYYQAEGYRCKVDEYAWCIVSIEMGNKFATQAAADDILNQLPEKWKTAAKDRSKTVLADIAKTGKHKARSSRSLAPASLPQH